MKKIKSKAKDKIKDVVVDTTKDVYIHKKMKLRGLSIDRHLTFDEEYAAALIVMKNKVKVLPDLKHNYRRAAGILYRRGFPGSVITSVLQNLRISNF